MAPGTPHFSPAASLTAIRAGHPLVHHITNYVVMNETANITLALGASPVMAHALEEVEEMAAGAAALVLNIGTLSPRVGRGDACWGAAPPTGTASPVVLDPSGREPPGCGPTRRGGSLPRSRSPSCAAMRPRSRP